jgi:hypothetical protein
MEPIDISSVRDEHENNMRLDDDFITYCRRSRTVLDIDRYNISM